eukprot:TRINITY_DN15780_c0_g1_i1.p1 TRINITY_DN15780_c0_g1~~TRINITY_DN15780_c0_g1_i1.p1  ORF type:complete len:225 (+),score=41.20 TRINITY_DN15780_c0_g1_i1:74-748(+)
MSAREQQLKFSLLAKRFPALRELSAADAQTVVATPTSPGKYDHVCEHIDIQPTQQMSKSPKFWRRLSMPTTIKEKPEPSPAAQRPFSPASPHQARQAIRRPSTSVVADTPFDAHHDWEQQRYLDSKTARISSDDFRNTNAEQAKRTILRRNTLLSRPEEDIEQEREDTRRRAAVNSQRLKEEDRERRMSLSAERRTSMSGGDGGDGLLERRMSSLSGRRQSTQP